LFLEDDPCRGGLGTWKAFFRFKHLSTAHYLSLDEDTDTTFDPIRSRLSKPLDQSGPAPVYHLVTSPDRNDPSTIFELDPTSVTSVLLNLDIITSLPFFLSFFFS